MLIKHERKAKLTADNASESFGPFSSPPSSISLYVTNFIYHDLYMLKILIGVIKREEKKENNHVGPKRCVWCRLGPFSLLRPSISPCSIPVDRISQYK